MHELTVAGPIGKIGRQCLARLGLDVFRRKSAHHYVLDLYGRSAHKQADIPRLPVFGELAAETIAHGRSQLYYDRLHVIYQALTNVVRRREHLGVVNLAEAGVYKGGTSYFIAAAMEALGLGGTALHGFDTFEGHAVKDLNATVDTFHRVGTFTDTDYESVRAHLQRFNNVILHQGRFQDTCSAISDLQFGFVHLDVDIYEPTRFALTFFDRRLVPGGVIVVDDYGFLTCPGARKAVDSFTEQRSDYVTFEWPTGQCVLVKPQEREQRQ